MERIRKNREISILLIIIVWIYIIIFFTGCYKKGAVLKKNFKITLISEDLEKDPYTGLGKAGVLEAEKKFGSKSKILDIGKIKDDNNIYKAVVESIQGSQLIIGIGDKSIPYINKASKNFREKDFVIVDKVLKEPNIKSIVYRNEEGGFLMGVVAGVETKNNNVGFIGGMEDSEIIRFLSGYIGGVKEVNKNAYINLINGERVRYVESFEDEEKAYEKAMELYDEGVDIVFSVCGKANKGVFKASKERGKRAIGTDRDEANFYKEYEGSIISSMVKGINISILESTESFLEGKFKCGERNIEEKGIKEGFINYAKSTEKYVSAETIDKLNKYKYQIGTGEIVVPKKTFEIS